MSLIVYQPQMTIQERVSSWLEKDCELDLSNVQDGERFCRVVNHPKYAYLLKTTDKPTKAKIKSVAAALFKSISFKDQDRTFRKQFRESITFLASTATGCEVLERIAKTKKRLTISECSSLKDSEFDSADDTLKISLNEKYYYIATNSSGEKIIQQGPAASALLHELIHVMGSFENEEQVNERKNDTDCLDFAMSDCEEFWTIASMRNISTSAAAPLKITALNANNERITFGVFNTPSENKLLLELGLPLRAAHKSFREYPPTRSEAIGLGLYPYFREKALADSLQNNQHFEVINGHRLSLLSVAASFGNKKFFQLLTDYGVPLNVQDDFGGALNTAVLFAQYEFAYELVTVMNVDLNLKNKHGQDVHSILLKKHPDKLNNKNPFFNKLVEAIEEKKTRV